MRRKLFLGGVLLVLLSFFYVSDLKKKDLADEIPPNRLIGVVVKQDYDKLILIVKTTEIAKESPLSVGEEVYFDFSTPKMNDLGNYSTRTERIQALKKYTVGSKIAFGFVNESVNKERVFDLALLDNISILEN